MLDREPAFLNVDDSTPARMLSMAEVAVGDSVAQAFAFNASHCEAFARVANDRAPVHEDERFAHARGFAGPIIQGLCVATRFSRLIGMYLPGEHAILEGISLKYRLPTYQMQDLLFVAEVTRRLPALRVVRLRLGVSSSAGVHVTGEAQCLIR